MFFFINLIISYDYYIKIPKTNLYLQGMKGVSSTLFFGEKNEKFHFNFKSSQESNILMNIYIVNFPNQVIDYVEPSDKIISYTYNGSDNQKFELRILNCINVFNIVTYNNKCMTHDNEKIFFEKCAIENINQAFEFVCANCHQFPEKFEELNSKEYLKYGFYDERVMSTLHKLKAISSDIISCFTFNEVCPLLKHNIDGNECSGFDILINDNKTPKYDSLLNNKPDSNTFKDKVCGFPGFNIQNLIDFNNQNQEIATGEDYFNADNKEIKSKMNEYNKKLAYLKDKLKGKIEQSKIGLDSLKNMKTTFLHPTHLYDSHHRLIRDRFGKLQSLYSGNNIHKNGLDMELNNGENKGLPGNSDCASQNKIKEIGSLLAEHV